MKINTGPLGATQASGSFGGGVWARNRFGMYIRNHTVPVDPASARQQTVRAAMAQLITRWSQTLTGVQRTAWALYGSSTAMKDKFGADIYLTGMNHYLRSNLCRVQGILAPIDDGPTVFEIPGEDPTYAVTGSEATQVLTLTYDATEAWADETGGYLFHYQGKPQNAQREFFDGPWRLVGFTTGETGVPPAAPDLIGVQFAIAQAQKQWVYARILRADGRISQPFRAETAVAA